MNESEYLNELRQSVAARSAATQDFSETAFAAMVAEALVDAGAVSSFEPAYFVHRGLRVDGYGIYEEEATLDLFVVEYGGQEDVQVLGKVDVEACIKRAEKFFDRAVEGDLAHEIDVGSSAWGLARQLAQIGSTFLRVRINILSDCRLSSTMKTVPVWMKREQEWSCRIWDLISVGRLLASGDPDPIIIDFEEMFGQGLPCLQANSGGEDLDSYLTVIPGDWLAKIYEHYSGRLLEQNVRTFLQVKGGVNKGIRKTILDEPHMFFAYNNGISATAEAADFVERDKHVLLKQVRHLQIVNGGQTTASIFNVLKKDKAQNLDQIRVQMKLSVVRPELIDTIVPKISEYSNSQNKVSAADFFSNHPFHQRIESFSRRVWAPAKEGSSQQTHWFYERTRGQYLNSAAYLSPAKKREFEATNPRSQLIQKTDLAKTHVTFMCMPQVVSQGAQKTIKFFAENVTSDWKDDGLSYGEDWYRDIIGATIVFRTLERLVQEAAWYAKGYRANIVTYSIALLQSELRRQGHELDFRKVWNKQQTSTTLNLVLLNIAEQVQSGIISGAERHQVANVTEWCKRDKCWEDLQKQISVRVDSDFERELVTREEKTSDQQSARRAQRVLNDIEAQTYVVGKGALYWSKLLGWANEGLVMTPGDISFLQLASTISARRLPTGPQCQRIVEVEKKAVSEGYKT